MRGLTVYKPGDEKVVPPADVGDFMGCLLFRLLKRGLRMMIGLLAGLADMMCLSWWSMSSVGEEQQHDQIGHFWPQTGHFTLYDRL